MRESLDELFEAFRDVPKPTSAKGCSQGCCMEDDEVRALLDADPRSLTAKQLVPYVDGAFMTLSNVPEFTYLLPGMLRVWSQEIVGDSFQSAFNERFHAALGRRYDGVAQLAPSFIVTQLDTPLREAVVAFMREALLARIGSGRSFIVHGMMTPAHAWFRLLATYGVVTGDVPALWTAWWDLPSPGHAIAAVQYASALICSRKDNPAFPWDRKRGGGSPCLWEYDTLDDKDWIWIPSNVEFLRQTLTPGYLTQKLTEAAAHLASPADRHVAAGLRQVLIAEPTRMQCRIDQLLEMLTTPNWQVRLDKSLEDLKRQEV